MGAVLSIEEPDHTVKFTVGVQHLREDVEYIARVVLHCVVAGGCL
jgi:hypothetical protein